MKGRMIEHKPKEVKTVGNKEMIVGVMFVAILLMGIAMVPVVLATPDDGLTISKPMPEGTPTASPQPIDYNMSKSPTELPARVANTPWRHVRLVKS